MFKRWIRNLLERCHIYSFVIYPIRTPFHTEGGLRIRVELTRIRPLRKKKDWIRPEGSGCDPRKTTWIRILPNKTLKFQYKNQYNWDINSLLKIWCINIERISNMDIKTGSDHFQNTDPDFLFLEIRIQIRSNHPDPTVSRSGFTTLTPRGGPGGGQHSRRYELSYSCHSHCERYCSVHRYSLKLWFKTSL